MTSREYVAAEAGNTERIILYREGLFWRAYERSAFALCTQVKSFKPTRKVLKTLDGADLISAGFPIGGEKSIMQGFRLLSSEPERLLSGKERLQQLCTPAVFILNTTVLNILQKSIKFH